MASYSRFDIDTHDYTLEQVLNEVKSMGYEVVRTKAVGGPPYPDERGFLIVGTDVTFADPQIIGGYGYPEHPVIGVFCPSRTMYVAGMKGATHDPDINKRVYNRLKRKFARKEK